MADLSSEENVDPALVSQLLLQRHEALLRSSMVLCTAGRILMVGLSVLVLMVPVGVFPLAAIVGTSALLAFYWTAHRQNTMRQIATLEATMTRSYGKRSLKDWGDRYIELRGVLEWGSVHFFDFLRIEPMVWLAWIVLSFVTRLFLGHAPVSVLGE